MTGILLIHSRSMQQRTHTDGPLETWVSADFRIIGDRHDRDADTKRRAILATASTMPTGELLVLVAQLLRDRTADTPAVADEFAVWCDRVAGGMPKEKP